MLPYIEVPDLPILGPNALAQGIPSAPVAIRPFGAIVLVAIGVGVVLSFRQAARSGVARSTLVPFLYFVLIGGFIGGHLVELGLYEPDVLRAEPTAIFDIASGQSSFGGFLGAAIGVGLFGVLRRRPLIGLVEVVASSLPAAWIIGRIACAVVHDHPGLRSQSWLAVAFPAGGRLDLGLIEAVAVVPLAVAFWLARKHPAPPGFYVSAMCLYYAPLRFGLDFLRATDGFSADRRYFGATPAQWGCLLVIGIGLYFSSRARLFRWRRVPHRAPV